MKMSRRLVRAWFGGCRRCHGRADADGFRVARRTFELYREESCGKCTPCREGTGWLEDILERIENGGG